MKRNIIKLIVLMALIISFSACEKNLDLFPTDQISESTFFKEANDFKLFANQFYGNLPSHSTWYTEAMSDLTAGPSGNTVSNGSYQPSEYSDTWNNNYDLIRNTTLLLTKLEESDGSLKNSSAVYGAEAHFFRAFAYFNLLQAYGGVPLITNILNTDDEELYAPRSTRIEIADQIIADLDMAIASLPVQSALSSADNGRVTKGAALAFKSRVALFEGTWQKFHSGSDANGYLQKAIDASKEVINSQQYELWDKSDQLGNQNLRHLFILDKNITNIAGLTKSANKEYILVNRFDKDLRGHYSMPPGNGELSPTRTFADMFLCTDGLPIDKSPLFKGKSKVTDEYQNRDSRMVTLLMIPLERYWSTAQAPWQRDWTRPNDPSTGFINNVEFGLRTVTGYTSVKFLSEVQGPLGHDWPVIRYAEVLLNYAEAVYEKNGSISDEDLDFSINKVKERAELPKLTNTFASANNLNMREEIRRERTIELFEEGFRYNDIRRWKIAETVLPKALLGIKYKGTQFETDPLWAGLNATFDENGYLIVESASKRQFDPAKHYLNPLPRRELILNKNLVQNPGWQ